MTIRLLAAGLVTIATPALADTPVLTVLTYDSFLSEWGPGPAVEAAFEAECACDLRLVGGGDGAALLARVQLEGAGTDVDVVLGLDTSLTAAATATGLFAPHGLADATGLPITYADPLFLPYDWGWFAFVHDRKLENPPTSFTELAESDLRVVIQDPRSSTPGLWSEAYGLFLAGEADLVLSYTTSPAYHLIAEGDDTKAAALFDEGHYLQIEVAGKLASSDQPELADRFLAFLLSDAVQSVIPETNWMYPAELPSAGLPRGFDQFRPASSLYLSPDAAASVRDAALAEWQAALTR
ncbi:MAG: thiamine ABC transporter substrate-binding protein [Rhodobacterales bacterium 12-65-15]|nr:MAG: thiamine ABC transporter substrate-binding protein [Rhodobacterales bacterium 12-65-15]